MLAGGKLVFLLSERVQRRTEWGKHYQRQLPSKQAWQVSLEVICFFFCFWDALQCTQFNHRHWASPSGILEQVLCSWFLLYGLCFMCLTLFSCFVPFVLFPCSSCWLMSLFLCTRLDFPLVYCLVSALLVLFYVWFCFFLPFRVIFCCCFLWFLTLFCLIMFQRPL